MNAHHLAQHQPGLHRHAVHALQLQHLRQAAFKRHRAFRHARHFDAARCNRRQAGQVELADFRRHVGAGLVHLFSQWPGDQVPDELTGLLDVAQAVLGTNAGKADEWRRVVERIEKAVRRKVQLALGVLR